MSALWCPVWRIFPMFAYYLWRWLATHLPDIHIYKMVAQRDTHNSSFRDFCQVRPGTGPGANLGFPISGVRWDDKRFVTFYRFKINLNNRDRTDIRYSDSRGWERIKINGRKHPKLQWIIWWNKKFSYSGLDLTGHGGRTYFIVYKKTRNVLACYSEHCGEQ